MRYWVAIFQARTSKVCALELVACKRAQVIIRKKKKQCDITFNTVTVIWQDRNEFCFLIFY